MPRRAGRPITDIDASFPALPPLVSSLLAASSQKYSSGPASANTPAPPFVPDEDTGHADVDVVIIGGGVNGAGVARDAALRGLRVALFERNDFAFGASGNSSGMIHGGPRYLTYDPSVTLSSCQDSGYIQDIAPHLLFRIPFLFPVAKSAISRPMLELMDGFFEAYDRYQPLKRGKQFGDSFVSRHPADKPDDRGIRRNVPLRTQFTNLRPLRFTELKSFHVDAVR